MNHCLKKPAKIKEFTLFTADKDMPMMDYLLGQTEIKINDLV
jgi:hypothetical protein